jgi:hypothetical protein
VRHLLFKFQLFAAKYRHRQICSDDVRESVLSNGFKRSLAMGRLDDRVTLRLEDQPEYDTHARIVVDQDRTHPGKVGQSA